MPVQLHILLFCTNICNKWCGRSPENVVEEIKNIVDSYHIKNIEFLDDTFTLDKARAAQIADEIVNNRLDILWSASSRVNTITRTLDTINKQRHITGPGEESGGDGGESRYADRRLVHHRHPG